jgi:hypothetical protein
VLLHRFVSIPGFVKTDVLIGECVGDALNGALLFSIAGMNMQLEPTPVRGKRLKTA